MNLTRYPHTAHQMDKFTLEEREEIRQMKKQPNLYHKMARSIAPRIFGHDDIKRGILLMLFGGRLPQQFKHTHANIIRRPQTRPHTDSHAVVESRLQIHTCTDTHTHTHAHAHHSTYAMYLRHRYTCALSHFKECTRPPRVGPNSAATSTFVWCVTSPIHSISFLCTINVRDIVLAFTAISPGYSTTTTTRAYKTYIALTLLRLAIRPPLSRSSSST